MGLFSSKPSLELAAEYPPANKQEHIDSLIRELRAKMERDYANGRTLRDAHPKIHGWGQGGAEPDSGVDRTEYGP